MAIRGWTSKSLLPPIARRGKIICLGLNYVDHAAEGGHAKPTYPSFFMRGSTSLVAHGQPIRRPRVSTQLDYEAELVAVIGKTARNVKKERAPPTSGGGSCLSGASLQEPPRQS